jgi:AhpC/TSA family
MRDSIRNNIEFWAQIVVTIAVVVVAGLLIKRLIVPPQPSALNLPRITAGERLNLPDVDWRQNKKSLVFFLNKDCHYCTTSAPFYRQLTDEASKQNVRLLAVLPNSAEEARAYVQSIKLPIDDIHIGPLASYKIPGTPTVLFVNSSGTVAGVWFGDASGREKQIREEFLTLAEKPVD